MAYEYETKLAQASMGTSASYQPDYLDQIYNPMTIEELKKESAHFPLVESLEQTGYAKSDVLVMKDPGWLKKLNELYTEENLEGLKASMILTLVQVYSGYLDEEFQAMTDEYISAVMGSVGAEPLKKRHIIRSTTCLAKQWESFM